jgi:hypothetical protein
MKVPLVTPGSNLPVPQIDMGGMTAISRAIQGFGAGMQEAGRDFSQVSIMLQELENRKDKVRAVNAAFSASITAKEKLIDLESGLTTVTDDVEYMTQWSEGWKEIREGALEGITDEQTRDILSTTLGNIEVQNYGEARRRADALFVDKNQGEALNNLNRLKALVKTAKNTGDVAAYTKEGLDIIESSSVTGVFDRSAAAKMKGAWTTDMAALWEDAKKDAIAQAKGIIVQKGTLDPGGTYLDLLAGVYDNVIDEKEKGALMVAMKAADEADKVQKKAELKEKERQLRDEDNQKIGDLYIRGQYGKALALAKLSPNIDGGDKKVWSDAIENAQQPKPEKIDPIVEAEEYSRLSQLLLDPATDKEELRKNIITSRKLGKERRLELVRDVAQVYAGETRDNLKWGLDWISQTVTPKRGIAARIIQTTLESERTMLAQAALKDWIKQQTTLGKPPSSDEIRLKAMELGEKYKPTLAERIKAMEEELKGEGVE